MNVKRDHSYGCHDGRCSRLKTLRHLEEAGIEGLLRSRAYDSSKISL